jgi:hypothetical protein
MTALTPNQRWAARKRAWENEHDRPVCACGRAMGVGVHRRGARTCGECAREIKAVGAAMRRERIYEAWHRGATLREIADLMGSTQGSIGVTVARMRETGWDMPYRRQRGYGR